MVNEQKHIETPREIGEPKRLSGWRFMERECTWTESCVETKDDEGGTTHASCGRTTKPGRGAVKRRFGMHERGEALAVYLSTVNILRRHFSCVIPLRSLRMSRGTESTRRKPRSAALKSEFTMHAQLAEGDGRAQHWSGGQSKTHRTVCASPIPSSVAAIRQRAAVRD